MNHKQIPQNAIIDTSVLITLYTLNLLDFLKLLYLEVRIPREVEREFLEKHKDEIERSFRFDFLLKFYDRNHSWFFQCNEYNSDLVSIYLTVKNLDKGEAEVFAQNQALDSSHELLLDEKKGRRVANNESVKYHGVLYILARLDLQFGICNYFDCIKRLKPFKVGAFPERLVMQVYDKVREKLNNY